MSKSVMNMESTCSLTNINFFQDLTKYNTRNPFKINLVFNEIYACIFGKKLRVFMHAYKCQHATSLKRIPLPQFCKTKCKNHKVKFENVPFFKPRSQRHWV